MSETFDFIEDFIEESIQKDFSEKIFNSKSIKWRLSNIKTFLNNQESSFVPEKTPTTVVSKNSKPIFQIIGDLENNEYQDLFGSFCKKHNIDVDNVIRARVVVTTNSPEKDKHSYPHIDHILDHNVFLYYLNTADGDTVFFDKVFGEDVSDMNIIKRSTPIVGKAINFNGKRFHALFQTNTKTIRCILNIEYRVKK